MRASLDALRTEARRPERVWNRSGSDASEVQEYLETFIGAFLKVECCMEYDANTRAELDYVVAIATAKKTSTLSNLPRIETALAHARARVAIGDGEHYTTPCWG